MNERLRFLSPLYDAGRAFDQPAPPSVRLGTRPCTINNMAAGVELTSSVSGYGCEFVDPLPRFIQGECSICLLVLREPHLTSCCGHNFCRHCIEAIIKIKKPCPLCQQCEFTTLHNKGLERSLKELVVTCEKALSGCNWKGELGKMDGHLNETCPYVDLRCRYVGCDTSANRQDMPQHEATCKFRPFNCEHCESHEATFDDVVNKHWPVCPKYPVSCSNKCDSLVERQHLQHHIDDECPLTEVLCEFSYAGCHVKVPRRDFQAHVSSDILIHLSMVSKMNKKLLHDNHQLSAKVIEIQTIMCEQKATITALQTNVGEQKAKITALETNMGEQKATIIALQTRTPCLEQRKQVSFRGWLDVWMMVVAIRWGGEAHNLILRQRLVQLVM